MNAYSPYIKKYWKLFLLAIFFLILEAGADLMQPLLMSRIINEGVMDKNTNAILQIGLLMLIVTLSGALFASTRSIIASIVSQNFGADLRRDLYKKTQKLSFASIDSHNRASLITRMTNDVTQVQNFFNGTMRIFVKAPLICIGAIIMAVNLNIELSTTLLIIIPLVFLIIFIVMKQTFPLFSKMQIAIDNVNIRMREYLSGVRVVKAFNRYDYEFAQFEESSAELANMSTNAMKWSSLMNPAISLVLNLGLVLILWLGGRFVEADNIGVGEVIAFTTYTTQIAGALGMMSMVFMMFVRAKASAIRIAEVINEKELSEDSEFEKNLVNDSALRFENVSHIYNTDNAKPTLSDINFSVKSGEKLGIIGATGSGKSTLVNLILKFYEPNAGCIYLDDLPLNNISTKSLREKVAIVPQKAVLFSGTIFENLRWGNVCATLEEINRAAKIANIHDFIETLPDGYQSIVEQKGVNFSGGQRQRLAIARALVRQPDILILDDSLSALDAFTEREINQELAQIDKIMTRIIVAQKISSVKDCDKIIVLDYGKIAAIGSHQELIKNSKIYQEIFASQIGKLEDHYEQSS